MLPPCFLEMHGPFGLLFTFPLWREDYLPWQRKLAVTVIGMQTRLWGCEGSGGDCSQRGRAGAVGRDRASLCHCCHMECSPRLPDFQRDLKSLDLTRLNLKHKTVQAKRNFPVGPHMAKCSSLWPLVCTISKSIEREWKIDFRLESKSSMSYLTEVGREGMVTSGTFGRDFFFKIIDFKQKLWEDSRKFPYTQWPCH